MTMTKFGLHRIVRQDPPIWKSGRPAAGAATVDQMAVLKLRTVSSLNDTDWRRISLHKTGQAAATRASRLNALAREQGICIEIKGTKLNKKGAPGGVFCRRSALPPAQRGVGRPRHATV